MIAASINDNLSKEMTLICCCCCCFKVQDLLFGRSFLSSFFSSLVRRIYKSNEWIYRVFISIYRTRPYQTFFRIFNMKFLILALCLTLSSAASLVDKLYSVEKQCYAGCQSNYFDTYAKLDACKAGSFVDLFFIFHW